MHRSTLAAARGLVCALTAAVVVPMTSVSARADTALEDQGLEDQSLYLVTLDGPGTSGLSSPLPAAIESLSLLQQQDETLTALGSPAPVYRWTTALNGYAVRLDAAQAAALSQDPRVALVEPDTVVPLATTGATTAATTAATRAGGLQVARSGGGAGVVIGFVDSGIDPDSPLFAPVSAAAPPARFRGTCEPGQDWTDAQCSTKVVGADWFVEGFGADKVRTTSSLSARDDEGHGTEMASLAAGSSGLNVRVGSTDLGLFSGVAPDAAIAVYKACWTAPDPVGDGCAGSDVVSAIDRATADGVDVLNLSMAGSTTTDTIERALLGATEAGVLTVAAAGNEPGQTSAHASPWVLTVGGTTGEDRRGVVRRSSGRDLAGASSAAEPVGPTRLVIGSSVAAAGSTRRMARLCLPGSLDAAKVAGRVVLCARGGVGRVLKSQAVKQADGTAMVLVNRGRGSTDADFHAVPTVHLDAAEGRTLRRWAIRHPRGRVSLRPSTAVSGERAVVPWSRRGDPSAAVVKPDLVAPAAGLVGAVPAALRGTPWDLVSGTSGAAAQVSGAAAALIARHGWSGAVTRSVLTTTATAPSGPARVVASGAGVLDDDDTTRPGLAFEAQPESFRGWLTDPQRNLNLPTVVLPRGGRTVVRRITNLGDRRRVFRVAASGFAGHAVSVSPAVVRLGPGRSATVLVSATRVGAARPDDGFLTWTGDNGSRARVPVLVS